MRTKNIWQIIIIYNILFFIFIPAASSQNLNWKYYNSENSPLLDNHILSFAEDDSGNIWIGTKYGGLVKYYKDQWEIFLPDSSIIPATFTRDRREMKKEIGPQYDAFYALVIDKFDNKWIGTKIGGLAKFDGNEWIVFNEDNSPLLDNYAWSVVMDRQDYIWIGTKHGGLAKFDGFSDWQIYNKNNSDLPDDNICALAIEDEQKIWIGTNNGLAIFDGFSWIVYDTSNSGLTSNQVWAIAFDSQGNKWIGTQFEGLFKFDGVNWINYNKSNSNIPDNTIVSITIDKEGNKWIGTLTGGLAKFDDVNWIIFNQDNSIIQDNFIIEIFVDSYNNIWVGTNIGLYVLKNPEMSRICNLQQTGNLVSAFSLSNTYPNPFSSSVNISVDVYSETQLKLTVFNIIGEKIKELGNLALSAGTHCFYWNGMNEESISLPNGVYFLQIVSETGMISTKLLLLR